MQYLTKDGTTVLHDEEDLGLISGYSWHIKTIQNKRYVISRPYLKGKRKMVSMHRLVMRVPEGKEVDHINGSGLDNRKSNLRICNRTQNARNVRVIRSKSGIKGVRFEKGKWRADIGSKDFGSKYLGRFKNKEDAREAYDAAVRKLFGTFGCTNEDMKK